MSGYDFERLLKPSLKKWAIKFSTQLYLNDQGADLIVEKFGEKTVIQAKKLGK